MRIRTFCAGAAALVAASLLLLSCAKDSSPVSDTPPCPYDPLIVYGTGSAGATVNGAGGTWSVAGAYKPSAQFLSDTIAGAGAGGFLRDTTVAGVRMNARVCAYSHALRTSVLYETILVLTLRDSSGRLDTGTYILTRKGLHPSARYATIDYILSDSLVSYALFASDTGTVRITAHDTCSHRLSGTFSGTIYDLLSPSSRYALAGGSFDVTYVGRYFAY